MLTLKAHIACVEFCGTQIPYRTSGDNVRVIPTTNCSTNDVPLSVLI